MQLKPYLKVGKWSAKEKEMVAQIEEAIAKKRSQDPNFDFNPADDMDDLKKLYRDILAEDVEFVEHSGEEVVNTGIGNKKPDDEFILSNDKPMKLDHTKENIDDEFRDPFNEASPIIRDYVKDDPFAQVEDAGNTKNTFEEPKNFDDAYNIPGADDDAQIRQGGATTGSKTNAKTSKTQAPKADPVNPAFDTMDKPSKNKQTKRFAKRIVGAVTMLLEKGFVFWTTRNINESKLAEYELGGEIDLDLLLSLDDGSQQTVKQFFANQCRNAEALSKIDKGDQEELAEALADVLMEKGITPTPTQVLIMSSLEIVGRQAITALAMTAQTNAVLNQLRAMKANTSDVDYEEQTNAAQHNTSHVPPVNNAEQKVDVETMEQEENALMSETTNVNVETNEEQDQTQETGLVKHETAE